MTNTHKPMSYLDCIEILKSELERIESPAKLDLPFEESRPPTQAFSEFLTNKEQGDWAEATFIANFNRTQKLLWAVKYGRSEDLVAGEAGFDVYYRSYQQELSKIGKRPDLLIFDRAWFSSNFDNVIDISTLSAEKLECIVPNAKYAVEVRSSAFISKKYDEVAVQAKNQSKEIIRSCARSLLNEFKTETYNFSGWLEYCESLLRVDVEDAGPAPRAASRRSTRRLEEASDLTKRIKSALHTLKARDFLSITPKSEDLTLVYRWIKKFNVPHYYCQVFFDRAVLLSFEEILKILTKPERENIDYFIESDEKNQRKVVFKINIALGREVMTEVIIPEHRSAMKELPKGRLLFYVRFSASTAQMPELIL